MRVRPRHVVRRGRLVRTLLVAAVVTTAASAQPGDALAADVTKVTPLLRIDETVSGHVSAATDPSGHVHIVYDHRGPEGDPVDPSLWLQTDASGRWVRSKLPVTASSPSLAIDGEGHRHVAALTTGGAIYVTDRSGAWKSRALLSDLSEDWPTGGGAQSTAIAVDALGEAHLAVVQADASLAYITNRRGYWTIRRLGNGPFKDAAIALDPATRRVHIVAATESAGIRHLTDTTGSWVQRTVSSGFDAFPAVAFRSGVAHVAFLREGAGAYYARITGTSVAVTKIPSSPGGWEGTAIAVTSGGRVHIVYGGVWEMGAGHVTNVSGAWVDTSLGSGWAPAIALGPAGSHQIFLARGPLYVRSYPLPTWTRRQATGSDDGAPSAATAPDGTVHVAYVRAGPAGIRIATLAGTSWTASTVTTDPEDRGPSLIVDSSGARHLTFIRTAASRNDLIHATDASGTWVESVLPMPATSSGGVWCASIAHDRADHLYVAAEITTATGWRIAVFTNRTGAWTSRLTPSSGRPECPAVDVDANGRVHLVYRYGPQLAYVNDVEGAFRVISRFGTISGFPPQKPDLVVRGTAVHIVWVGDGGYRHLTNSSGAWVDSNLGHGGGSSGPSIAIDPSGVVSIAWVASNLSTGPGGLLVTSGSGATRRTLLLDGGHLSGTPSLAKTPDGRMRVAYAREGIGMIMLAE